jgi:hypothetical protein
VIADPGFKHPLSLGLGLAFLLIAFPVLLVRGIGIHRLRQRFPRIEGDSIQQTFRWVSTEVDYTTSRGAGQMPLNYSLGLRALHLSAPFPFSLGASGKASIPWPQVRVVDRSRRKKSRWLEAIPLIGTSLIRIEFQADDYPATFTLTGRCARALLEYLDNPSLS